MNIHELAGISFNNKMIDHVELLRKIHVYILYVLILNPESQLILKLSCMYLLAAVEIDLPDIIIKVQICSDSNPLYMQSNIYILDYLEAGGIRFSIRTLVYTYVRLTGISD